MNVSAAVMTGQGTGAISTIQVFGKKAGTIVKKIFKSTQAKPPTFKPGQILLGTISDGGETIDQVTIGCESLQSFAINCHGNPLIVEMIMQLLKSRGATVITAEQLLCKILSVEESLNTIALEAKLTQQKAKTIDGTEIIANQIDSGLGKTNYQWPYRCNCRPAKYRQKHIVKLSGRPTKSNRDRYQRHNARLGQCQMPDWSSFRRANRHSRVI